MSDNMSNLMNQISNMLNSNEIPDDIKNMMSNLSKSQKDSSTSNTASPNEISNSSQAPDLDIKTIMKIKKIMDSMKETKNDPRANLLR